MIRVNSMHSKCRVQIYPHTKLPLGIKRHTFLKPHTPHVCFTSDLNVSLSNKLVQMGGRRGGQPFAECSNWLSCHLSGRRRRRRPQSSIVCLRLSPFMIPAHRTRPNGYRSIWRARCDTIHMTHTAQFRRWQSNPRTVWRVSIAKHKKNWHWFVWAIIQYLDATRFQIVRHKMCAFILIWKCRRKVKYYGL